MVDAAELDDPLPDPKIYLAARYSRKREVRSIAELIRKAGITVVSTWQDKPEGPIAENEIDSNEDYFITEAMADIDEIDTANTLLFFSEDPNVGVPRGGRHVEYGYFLKMKREKPELQIYIIGPTENIFNLFANERFADVPTFIYEMSQRIG